MKILDLCKIKGLNENAGEFSIVDHMASMYGLKAKQVDVTFKKVSGSKTKECFDNSYRYVSSINTEATYVLGYMLFHGMPIEHTWIKEGGKYHEITIKSDDAEYYSLVEFNFSELLDLVSKSLRAPDLYEYRRHGKK